MARSRGEKTPTYGMKPAAKPPADVYVGMLGLTCFAMLVGIAALFIESTEYDTSTPPAPAALALPKSEPLPDVAGGNVQAGPLWPDAVSAKPAEVPAPVEAPVVAPAPVPPPVPVAVVPPVVAPVQPPANAGGSPVPSPLVIPGGAATPAGNAPAGPVPSPLVIPGGAPTPSPLVVPPPGR